MSKITLSEWKGIHPLVRTLFIGTFFMVTVNAMSLLFLPLYLMKYSNLSAAEIGILVGCGPLASTVGGVMGGALSDKFGRKRILLGSLFSTGIFLFAIGLTTYPILLGVLVILSGVSQAFFVPTAKALIGDVTPEEKRVRVFSIRYVIVNGAYAVGPIIGAWFVNSDYANLPFLIAGAIHLMFMLGLDKEYKKWDNLINTQGSRGNNGSSKVSFAKSLQTVASDSVILSLIAGGILVNFVEGQWSVPLAFVTESRLENAAQVISLTVGVNAIGVILLQLPISKWVDVQKPVHGLVIGCIFCAIGMVGIAFSYYWYSFALSMAIFTVGEIIVVLSEFRLLDSVTPDDLRGTYYGAQNITIMGSFLGPWLSGIWIDTWGGEVAFTLLAGTILVSIIFFWLGIRIHSRKNLEG
ncbi:MDR family MFS transporter [Brevibacillus migulae]|uniref:MDR family MFS transporter n=1 Tax=Brevibacillus migulae TaxID=1644114 RepID=UPI00106E2147|nr:MFS transporter [Brevibacillus migulae]